MQALLVVVFLILMLGGIAIAIYFAIKSRAKGARKNSAGIITSAAVAGVFFLMLIFIPSSVHVVNSGELAVVKVWGEAKETKTAGTHFDFWVSTAYDYYDLKTQEINENIVAYSLDAQTMDSSLVVQFRIQEDKAIDINRQFGSIENLANRIKGMAIEKAKVVLSGQSAMDIIATRNVLSKKLEAELTEYIKPYYVDLTLVVITNIDFSDAFEKVVEDKMIAEQQKLQAQYESEKRIIEAEASLAVSKKEAEEAIERAKGAAEAKIEEARAQAERIRLKSIETARMLGFAIITDDSGNQTIDFSESSDAERKLISDYLQYIEYLEKWDGELPDVVGGGDTSIIIPKP